MGSGYRILEDGFYFFEKVDRDYSATQEYCKTAFGSNVVGKLWEPKTLKINNLVGAEAKYIFGTYNRFWIGISNDGKFRYQSSGETATGTCHILVKIKKPVILRHGSVCTMLLDLQNGGQVFFAQAVASNFILFVKLTLKHFFHHRMMK